MKHIIGLYNWMNVLVLMLVWKRVLGSTFFGKYQYISISSPANKWREISTTVWFWGFQSYSIYLLISSWYYPQLLTSLVSKVWCSVFHWVFHLEQTTKNPPNLGKNTINKSKSLSLETCTKSIETYWIFRSTQQIHHHHNSSDHKVMNILILIDFVKWFNILHLKNIP